VTGHLPLESVDRGDAVIELRDVVKEYPGSPPVRALDGVSMRIDRGQLVAMVGPSGSGKSTMLNVMGALDRPSSGQVLVEGRDIATLGDAALSAVRGRAIGFVFQHFHLIDGQRALDNVADGLLYRGIGLAERRERAAVALDQVGLGHRGGHRPGALSGGERQRVAIARAIVGSPSIVLADEPTGNLDTATGQAVLALLEELNDQGSTIVVITHDLAISKRLPRCISLRDGAIVGDRMPESAGVGVGS
jgi:putative ABC transport system ATP-binding protein